MKTLLITGFEPFNNEVINPSWSAVERLPDVISGYELTKLCLPVVFGEAAKTVISVAEKIDPDVILCIGQAGGRSAVTPELVGINLRYARIPDNKGAQPKDESIVNGGENAYFSTLPVRKMADAINDIGIPSQVSYSAGAYVCNDLLYTLLHNFKDTGKRVAFIHIPYCTEQNKTPSMDIDTIVKALITAIESIDA
jgi:pyroglutamyl-peptidase